MMRAEGWEKRLAALVDAVRGWTFQMGERDCLRFACAVIEAVTGEDRWAVFAGAYATEREALRLLARYGETFEDAADWFFGPRCEVRFARRGDLVAYPGPGVLLPLGVCLDRGRAALLRPEQGLVLVQATGAKYAWRVG